MNLNRNLNTREFNSIYCLVLDPRFKLEFFKLRADRSQPKLKAAKDNAHNLWQTLYKPVGHATSTTQIGDLANGQQFVSLLWAASTAEQVIK